MGYRVGVCHISIMCAILNCLIMAVAMGAGVAAPLTRSTVKMKLSGGQVVAYCGPEGYWVLEPGDSVVLGCRNDSLTLNGRAIDVRSFPSARICDLSLLRQLFGGAPRVQRLLQEYGALPDSSRWYTAVGRYTAEVESFVHEGARADAESLVDDWYYRSVPSPRPDYSRILDLLAGLKWRQNPNPVYAEITWIWLRGVPIPLTMDSKFSCATVDSLSSYLLRMAKSGRAFRAELGSALVFFHEK